MGLFGVCSVRGLNINSMKSCVRAPCPWREDTRNSCVIFCSPAQHLPLGAPVDIMFMQKFIFCKNWNYWLLSERYPNLDKHLSLLCSTVLIKPWYVIIIKLFITRHVLKTLSHIFEVWPEGYFMFSGEANRAWWSPNNTYNPIGNCR